MYGKMIDGVLYVSTNQQEGYKPFEYTERPAVPEGYHAAYFWAEMDETFVQTWEAVADYEEDISDAEALEILLGGDGE